MSALSAHSWKPRQTNRGVDCSPARPTLWMPTAAIARRCANGSVPALVVIESLRPDCRTRSIRPRLQELLASSSLSGAGRSQDGEIATRRPPFAASSIPAMTASTCSARVAAGPMGPAVDDCARHVGEAEAAVVGEFRPCARPVRSPRRSCGRFGIVCQSPSCPAIRDRRRTSWGLAAGADAFWPWSSIGGHAVLPDVPTRQEGEMRAAEAKSSRRGRW